MLFKNRAEAGRALIDTVGLMMVRPYVIAAIPRGGVAVALPIAERLAVPLAISYARRLTDPRDPDRAFGAVDEDGRRFIEPSAIAALGLNSTDIEHAAARVAADIEHRVALYRIPPLGRSVEGSGVVLVDDGVTTGLTMQAAVDYARRHGDARSVSRYPAPPRTPREGCARW